MIVQISEGFIKNKMNCEHIYNKNTYQTIMALTKSNNTLSLAQQQMNEHYLFTWLTFNQDSAQREEMELITFTGQGGRNRQSNTDVSLIQKKSCF